MRRHVQVLAILMIVQGTLECLGAVVYALIPSDAPGASRELEIALFVGIPLAIFAAGALRVVAGCLNLSYRGLLLGHVSLVAGLASTITCFCCLSSFGLLVYGLSVYHRPGVRRAFALRAEGASRDQIEAALS